jgi:hypothetical protein
MNTTETRLKEALRSVADTVGSADVPALALPNRTHSRLRRAALGLAATAVAAAVAGTLTLNPFGPGPVSPTSGSPSGKADLIVYFCVPGSFNRSCGNRDATEQEKRAVLRALRRLSPKKIIYVSREDAVREFHTEMPSLPNAMVGDVPDSFRVTLKHPGDALEGGGTIFGLPGVDLVSEGNPGVVVRKENPGEPANPWRDKGDIAVFLCPTSRPSPPCHGASGSERGDITNMILRRTRGTSVTFQSSAESLAWYRRWDPAMAKLTAADVPDALLVHLSAPNPVKVAGLARMLARLDGVESVSPERYEAGPPIKTWEAVDRLLTKE